MTLVILTLDADMSLLFVITAMPVPMIRVTKPLGVSTLSLIVTTITHARTILAVSKTDAYTLSLTVMTKMLAPLVPVILKKVVHMRM
jgi:hypothetical protein